MLIICQLNGFYHLSDANPMPSGRYPNQPMTNGPIGQSSPYLGRRNLDEHKYYNYQGGGVRQFSNQ